MSDITDTVTGLDRDNPQAGGRGGRQRAAAIDAQVSAAVGARPPGGGETGGPMHPSAVRPRYVPTAQERATRTYGSPIETNK